MSWWEGSDKGYSVIQEARRQSSPQSCVMYHPDMGEVVAAYCYLRAWGSKDRLDVKGMFQTELKSDDGGHTKTWVYVVDGDKPEPLLGDDDAEDLGMGMDTSKGYMYIQRRLQEEEKQVLGTNSKDRKSCQELLTN